MLEYTAELETTFALAGDHTELQYRFHKSPLKIAKTFARDQRQIGVCIMDCSPGMMAGDKYRLTWRLLPEANVFITNQSYTKVHPSKEQPAYQLQSFHIAKNSRLEYKPEPIMLYNEASFRSDTEIRLEARSVVFWTDIVCPGRVLRGEVFQYAAYDSRMKVYYDNQLVYYNRQFVEPSSLKENAGFRRLGGWENYTHQGTLYIFSDQIKHEHLVTLQTLLIEYPKLYCGVSLTYQHGLIVSVMGSSVWELQQLLDEVRRVMIISL
jgi:urease accessory protein